MEFRTIQLGKLTLKTPLLLAPIAGYCDLSFRLVARSCGDVGLACTDLLSPEACLRETSTTMRLARTDEFDKPLCMQLYGGDVDKLCLGAQWAVDHGADVVDINMGCPVDKVTKKDGGSKLLCDPLKTVRMVERIARVLGDTPLTCKLRLGWDDTCIVAPKLARDLEEAGAQLITIHGRTTAMKFTGQARLDGIAEVVAAVRSIPVIGNGDIKTPQDAQRMMEVTKCAGLMIGRGALSKPWIFRDIWHYLNHGTVPEKPSLEKICGLMRDHFQNMIRYDGLRRALIEMRRRVSWWAKELTPCKRLRQDMRLVEDEAHFERIVEEFIHWRNSQPLHAAADETDELASV